MDDSESQLEAFNRKIVHENIALICVINTFVVTGFCGNILSVVFFGFKERKNTNDALIALLTTSNAIANILAVGEVVKYINYYNFHNEIGCEVHYFLTHSFTKISGVMLLFIAVDRHRLLCHPFSWQLTPKIISVSLPTVALYLVSSSAVQLRIAHIERIEIMRHEENGPVLKNVQTIKMTTETNVTTLVPGQSVFNKTRLKLECVNTTAANNGTNLSHIEELNMTSADTKFMIAHVCTNKGKLSESNDILLEISNVSDVVVTVTTFSLILYCYVSTVKVIYHHWKKRKTLQQSAISKRKNEKLRTDIKITIMTVTFTVMSLLSFTPYYVAKSLQTSDLINSDQVRLRLISASYMINNAIDPYVLLGFIPNFRHFVKQLLCFGSRKTKERTVVKDRVSNKASNDSKTPVLSK